MQTSAQREEFLAGVFTTIFEDYGTNSWRQVASYHWVDLPKDKVNGRIVDLQDDGKEHSVTINTIRTGIARISRGEVEIGRAYHDRILQASHENDAGGIDAYDADIILQAGIFGEVTYG
jgi:hypothetical protein